jgi:TRAP transporter TAXI family solute receptor
MVLPKLSRKQWQLIAAVLIATLLIAIWLIARYVSPAPPRTLQMTTGAADGAYHQAALKYQAYLKDNGVKLELQISGGSVQNLERLNAGTPVGFVQGGLGLLSIDPQKSDEDTPLRSLGVIGFEPIWIFTHSAELSKNLAQGLDALAGKKVAIGAVGSGTRKVALDLLQSYGLDNQRALLSPDSGLAAAKMLADGALDAVFLIAAPQAPAVQLLLGKADIQVASLAHAEGLTRRLPYLSLVTLKAASVDPLRKIPAQDITLLTTTANLVIREDLHPALAYLLLEAARDIHKGATLLNRPGDFPHARATDFPLADEAQRYYKEGRPFLQRYLPFWLANFVQRLILILVPLLAIAIPVFKTIPSLLNFKERTRLYRRYGILLDMERDLRDRQLSAAEITTAYAQLAKVEHDISHTKFPLEFSDRVYTLRQHIDYVRGQLKTEAESLEKT